MNVNIINSYNYSFSRISSSTTKQAISSINESSPTQKVLGYNVDKDGYFMEDFNKAAGIPNDYKIHSSTMQSIVNVNENAMFFFKSFSHIDIAKTANNAYKILTQVVDENTLNKDKFTNEDIKAMPQGYEYDETSMKVTKIYEKVEDYFGATMDKKAARHSITTTFYNNSVSNFYSSPLGGKLRPATNIFDNNAGGKEESGTGMYFNTTQEKYTNSDKSVTKGGLLVGIMNNNLHAREGKTTFVGKLHGLDKQVSAHEARLQDKLFYMMNPNIDKVSDASIDALSEDFGDYIRWYKKNRRIKNGHFSDVKSNENETKSPAQILFESIEKSQKEMLEKISQKAKEDKIEEQKAYQQKLEAKTLKKLLENSKESLNEMVNFILKVQESLNATASQKSNITENELKKAFLSLFDNTNSQKSNLDVKV